HTYCFSMLSGPSTKGYISDHTHPHTYTHTHTHTHTHCSRTYSFTYLTSTLTHIQPTIALHSFSVTSLLCAHADTHTNTHTHTRARNKKNNITSAWELAEYG